MINKQKFLGKRPLEAGQKDAVHVAIVSVRADGPVDAGSRVKINEHGEGKSVGYHNKDFDGIADPFMKDSVVAGQFFWMLIDPKEIGEVAHVWEHPKHQFTAPTREVRRNTYLEGYAKDLGLTYEQLFEALNTAIYKDGTTDYAGTIRNEEDFKEVLDSIESYDLWYEWGNETGYEFDNLGTDCCPEYDYPSMRGVFRYI